MIRSNQSVFWWLKAEMKSNQDKVGIGPLVKGRRNLIAVLMGFFLPAAAMTAQASIESYTVNYGSESSPLVVSDLGLTDFPVSLSLPQFNPLQGSLEEIILTLSSTDIVGAEVLNETGSVQSYSHAFANMTVDVTGPNSLQTTTTLLSGQYSGTVSPGAPIHVGSTSGTALSSTQNVPSSGFAMYTGSGMVSLDLAGNASAGSFGGSGPAGVFFGGFADSFGSVEVQYVYAAVPEPATLCAGFAALVFGLLKLTRFARQG